MTVSALPISDEEVLLVPSSSWPSYIAALAAGGPEPGRVVLYVEPGTSPPPDSIAFVDDVVEAGDADGLRRALDRRFGAVRTWAETLSDEALASLPLARGHPALDALPSEILQALGGNPDLMAALNHAGATEALLRGVRPALRGASARVEAPPEASPALVAAVILLALARAGVRPRGRLLRGEDTQGGEATLPLADDLAEVLADGAALHADLAGTHLTYAFAEEGQAGATLMITAKHPSFSVEVRRGDRSVWNGTATEGRIELPLDLFAQARPDGADEVRIAITLSPPELRQ